MKKWFLLLLSLFLIGFVIGEAGPEVGGLAENFGIGNNAEADAADLQDKIDTYVPIDESGKIDYGKYKPFMTKAEVRIASINLWLDENVGWMRYIFHMKPAISLLFFINVYFILLFLSIFALGGEGLWFFIEEKEKARIFGFAVFAVFLIVRLYYGMAVVVYNWWIYFWNVFVQASIWVGAIGFVLFLVLLFFLPAVLATITAAIARYNAGKRVAKEKMKLAASVEAVDAFMGQVGRH